jgi:oligopeptide/dipeptide ABC transporter ATP-binding protein
MEDALEPALTVTDLRVSFKTLLGKVQAVRGLNFEVMPGEVLGVVGESGSGKSVTFLGIMSLLSKNAIVEGSAKVGNIEMVGATPKQLGRVRGKEMAMIFQDPLSALNPVQKVGKQVAEMILSHNKGMSDSVANARSVELLDLVGIPQAKQRARQYAHEFSGGMRQRVMIAMAIANDPKVLIADEPTTALDVTVQAQILEVIDNIRREFSTAVVLITHDLGVVARMADRIQVMYAGRIVERGDVHAIFESTDHPYTRGLMKSLPGLGRERLTPIPGSPPNMLQPPSGCAFRVRCPYAIEACAEVDPPLLTVHKTETACIRAEELEPVT